MSLDAENFQRELESLRGIGSLDVIKEGGCAAFDLHVTFLTLPGDLPEMTVSGHYWIIFCAMRKVPFCWVHIFP